MAFFFVPRPSGIKFILVKIVNEKKLQSDFKSAQRERAVDNQIYKYVCQAQKALYDLDSQKDITQPDNPFYWPKGAVKEKELSHDDPKEKQDLEELELLQKNPLISNQIIHKRVPGNNDISSVTAWSNVWVDFQAVTLGLKSLWTEIWNLFSDKDDSDFNEDDNYVQKDNTEEEEINYAQLLEGKDSRSCSATLLDLRTDA